jgi:hypothetical protein
VKTGLAWWQKTWWRGGFVVRESIQAGLSDGPYTQLVIRFGTAIQAAASVRRPPDDVLSTGTSQDGDTGEG